MKSNKPLIRRTFRQERFYILIKKQLKGTATFSDLTELDDIVNRDPEIRESILEEMQDNNYPADGPEHKTIVTILKAKPKSFLEQLRAVISRWFIVDARVMRAL